MRSIVPHILVRDDHVASTLAKDGYKVISSNDLNIIYSDIKIPENPTRDSLDSLTAEVRQSFDKLFRIEEKESDPHVLIRKAIRGNLVDGKPSGYIVELTENGPNVCALNQMSSIPLLAGYGSLLDPNELACNAKDGDLRNSLTNEKKKYLAGKNGIAEKINYAKIKGTQLIFNRAATAKRYGETQNERNGWAVLNTKQVDDAYAHVSIFNPKDLTDDPVSYFARENFDEIEYARRRIMPEQIELLNNSKLSLENGIWILDSPQISDVEGELSTIIPNANAKISERYMNMIANGLAGADQVVSGFS